MDSGTIRWRMHSLAQVASCQLQKLTPVRGLMRAIPWEHIDPPDIDVEKIAKDIWRTIERTIQGIYRALINAIAAATTTIKNVANGIASAIADGVRMMIAGIMAMVDFVVKLFKDIALLMWELGQWLIGVLSSAWDRITSTFKEILKAASWVLKGIIMLVIEAAKKVLKTIGVNIGGGFGTLEAELINTERDKIKVKIYTEKHQWQNIGTELYSVFVKITTTNTELMKFIMALPPAGVIFETSTQVGKITHEEYAWSETLNETRYRAWLEKFKANILTLFIGAISAGNAFLLAFDASLRGGVSIPVAAALFSAAIVAYAAPLIVFLSKYSEILNNGTVGDIELAEVCASGIFYGYVLITILYAILTMGTIESVPEPYTKTQMIGSAILYMIAPILAFFLAGEECVLMVSLIIEAILEIVGFLTDAIGLLAEVVVRHMSITGKLTAIFLGVMMCLASTLALFTGPRDMIGAAAEKRREAYADIPSIYMGVFECSGGELRVGITLEGSKEERGEEHDTIERVVVDIAGPGGGYKPYEDAHIEIQNADDVINLLVIEKHNQTHYICLLYTSPSPRDRG